MTTRARRRWIALLLSVAAALAGAVSLALPRLESGAYASFVRPDKRYRVLVRRRPSLWAMPGQGSDAAGRVELWDAHGRLLHETDMELVQLVEQVEWEERWAHIKGVADWNLPE